MIDSTLAPSPLLKTLTTVARWALGLVLTAWFVFGLAWGALHWLIVPRIGEFRPQLEARATQVLGVPVRIGAIAAYSSGMIPSFELTDVQLFDAQGREALRLPRVLAALSPRSILHLGFEQLYVDRPELNIRRGMDGKIVVAGLDFSNSSDSGHGAADWFFSQIEFAIHDGTILWTDELRAAPTLALRQVALVVRNQARRHDMRLDATPPAPWGERFSVMGRLRQPLLSLHNGRWQEWEGQLYAALTRVDLSELRRYADVGIDLHQGNGAVTSWIDVSRGQLVGAVADVALAQVSITLGTGLQALDLQSVRGRLGGRLLASGFEFSTQSLQFDTRDGLHWPGGNVSVMYLGAEGKMAARGELKADKLDLAALSQIANRLPIDPQARATLLAYAPKGLVERLQASWQGSMGAFSKYEAKGQVSQFELAARAATPALNATRSPTSTPPVALGSPGIRGASIEFDLNQSAGRASIRLANGAVELPGMFDEPVIPISQLSTDAKWQINGERIAVQLPNMKFSNADAQGEAQVIWETSDPETSRGRARFPGVLDLQASLSRADGTRVHRYLPTIIRRPVRDYVHDAVVAGTASGVKFKVKGDLHNMPFTDPKQGEFRISANVQNATYAYVPRSIQPPDALPWPALTQLSGELVIERTQLQVRAAHARIGATAGLQINKVEALIPDLSHGATVTVNAEARGALGEGLGIVNGSPLGAMIGRALGRAVASANADYKLKLILPIATIEKSTLQGSVTLSNNDIQIAPDTPKLTRARGVVNFSEKGFTITGGRARMLGGDVRLEGGSAALSGTSAAVGAARAAAPIVIRASGTASAEGLRQAKELGFVARIAQHASGSAAYTAVLGFRRGEPELSVTSNLQGLSLSLPAPLNKSAEALLPFRLETALVRESLLATPGGPVRLQDQFALELGRVASILYIRDLSGPELRVIRGSIAVGLSPQESAPLPDEGVVANINLSAVDLDAWSAVLSQAAGTSLAAAVPATATVARVPGAAATSAALTYLPTSMAVRARELTVGGRKLHNVVAGGSRDGLLWRANLDASELNGYLEYRQPSDAGAGRVHARLARLTIAPGAVSDVEALLDEQPASIPALDIVVEDFELRGKRLGRVEVEAINRGPGAVARDGGVREWRLNKFNMIMPEAVLTATGNWASINAQNGVGAAAPSPSRSAPERRRTVLNFKLDIADGGELLSRLGMKGVIRKGRGKMEGQVAWLGSPITLDYPSMSGAFTVNVEAGQFLKAEPGIAKLLGVLSLQSLPRRLTLDFRDVFSEGFSFDFIRGDVTIEQGIAKTNNLQMKGVNAAVLMEGRADIAKETQDLKVVVVPEINAGTASLIASVINPAIGLGTFLAQMFLRKPLSEAATQELHIDGSWVDPKITRVPRKTATGSTNEVTR
ncbi:YhdP family protein [Rhodoferax sp. UBA5149]|uniref:YhdP family protein n=1 Tax=Rhodoferax sp. UBA5149 TaxID=1947379 RepID=UPI0025E4FE40|nr:YhdP family protein [Rhodoferax sp. UBA5149]